MDKLPLSYLQWGSHQERAQALKDFRGGRDLHAKTSEQIKFALVHRTDSPEHDSTDRASSGIQGVD